MPSWIKAAAVKVDKLLFHAWVTRFGNGVFLVGAVVFVGGRALRLSDPLTIAGIVLMLVGLVRGALPEPKDKQQVEQVKTRPITWDDLKRIEVPVPQPAPEDVRREQAAKNGARRVANEMKTSRKTAEKAQLRGQWWYVQLEGLQSHEWEQARDLLAEFAPSAHDEVAEAYVQAAHLNTAANLAYAGDVDDIRDDEKLALSIFMGLSQNAIKALQGYYE